MQAYSDRINHALAFAAKYRSPQAPAVGEMRFLAHPASVAIVLARYRTDEATIVGSIIHHVLTVSPVGVREEMEAKTAERFGRHVLEIARDAADPAVDRRGDPPSWLHRKRHRMVRIATMCPAALDVCCADEIHQCGSAIAIVERLGAEYLPQHGLPGEGQALSWYTDLATTLQQRHDWPTRALGEELLALHQRFAEVLRNHP